MKFTKGLAVLFVMSALGSCFDPPEFPVVPHIEFKEVEFYQAAMVAPPNTQPPDSLVLYLDFRDGDGDLGLDQENPRYQSDPFHNVSYFLTNDADKQHPIEITTYKAGSSNQNLYDYIAVPEGTKGKLISPQIKKRPGYEWLPEFDCRFYEYAPNKKLIVSDSSLLNVKPDSIFRLPSSSGGLVTVYQFSDSLYFKPNPNFFNIFVEFLVREPSHPNADAEGYYVYDWRDDLGNCTLNMNNRFPVLTDKSSALDGTIRYSMKSTGMNLNFSIKTLKLRISIKDRELHDSNVITTQPFTLDQIRKSN